MRAHLEHQKEALVFFRMVGKMVADVFSSNDGGRDLLPDKKM